MSDVRTFLETYFLHFNSRTTVEAAKAWEAHLEKGGKMFVSLAGAMSTARMGRILGRMIRAGKVHGVSCTGANLEEDAFNLVSAKDYRFISDWRGLRAEDEKTLYDSGFNRVTDICIPEKVMRNVEERLIARWRKACEDGERKLPSQYLWDVMGEPGIEKSFQLSRDESWILAAKDMGVPIWTPGWEDSTTGNMFTVAVRQKRVPRHDCVAPGTEQMSSLIDWYLEASGYNAAKKRGTKVEGPGIGFFQIGGGIAGDFAICAVPAIIQDLKIADAPFWGYFCQIGDSVTSYGGYSGAVPNEKITWGKLDVDTPKFMIQSDATIVAPLIFGYLLKD